ncbi:hypothetical protein V6N13_088498 [Hibiscus sabdariffa]|uniref:Uncharacterized protein n=1 Tax=Hibiscus sabdariffa TaxID=183260 RepID=A0ABR2FZZ0_9ROSI
MSLSSPSKDYELLVTFWRMVFPYWRILFKLWPLTLPDSYSCAMYCSFRLFPQMGYVRKLGSCTNTGWSMDGATDDDCASFSLDAAHCSRQLCSCLVQYFLLTTLSASAHLQFKAQITTVQKYLCL